MLRSYIKTFNLLWVQTTEFLYKNMTVSNLPVRVQDRYGTVYRHAAVEFVLEHVQVVQAVRLARRRGGEGQPVRVLGDT